MLSGEFEDTLTGFEGMFGTLADSVPSPVKVPHRDGFVFRYKEQSPEQAIVLKLARCISTLRAAQDLLKLGYTQEKSSLQRALDEYQEEITFLSLAITLDGIEDIHQRFLDGFFWDNQLDRAIENREGEKRPYVNRKDMRLAIDRLAAEHSSRSGLPVSKTSGLAYKLGNMYSGYVHGDAISTMEMFGGPVPHFHLRGMAGTPLVAAHERDLWNQFYRVTQAFAYASMAMAKPQVFLQAEAIQEKLERAVGVNYPRMGENPS